MTELDKLILDKPITMEEFSQALYKLGNDKVPGSHGLPAKIYKVFWGLIKNYCYAAFMHAIKMGQLHSSTRKGVLCLIPKKGKQLEYIKNWRPLTLLNTDHKIFVKVLARCIKPILKYIISHEQTVYMEGRFIGLNLRKLVDLMLYIETNEIPALLISISISLISSVLLPLSSGQ